MIPSELEKAAEIAKSIAHGEFRLLCPKMCLAPTLTNDAEDADFKGVGMIETSPRGGLRYRMAFDQGLPRSHWHDMATPPAHVESINELYRLIAIDSVGREWRSAPVRGRFNPFVDQNGRGEVVELLDTISHYETCSPDHAPSVALIFPVPPRMRLPLSGWTRQVHTRHDEEIAVRITADHCQYQTEECDVLIECADDDPLVIVATPHDAKMVPLGFEQRVLDALMLVLGQRFSPALSLRTQGNHTDWHIARGPYWDPEGMVRPPVLATSEVNIWSLAAAYQDKISREWPHAFGTRDPISSAMAEISLGSQGTLQSASLALAIGIEAIGKAVSLRERYPPKTASSLKIDSVMEYLRRWNGDKTTREFVLTRLSQFKGPDFAKCLYAFADAKCIGHSTIDIWKNMRPRLAHGVFGEVEQLSPDDEQHVVQTSVDSYYAMLGLAYRMIADFIGFDGPLVDFSRPDWGLGPIV